MGSCVHLLNLQGQRQDQKEGSSYLGGVALMSSLWSWWDTCEQVSHLPPVPDQNGQGQLPL